MVMTIHARAVQVPEPASTVMAEGPTLPPDAGPVLKIGRWTLDRSSREVKDGEQFRRLSPRAMDVLLTLAHAQGAVVRRADLMDAVWPDVHVGDESLTQAVAEIRRALGERPDGKQYIETVPKAGYRLAACVVASDNVPETCAADHGTSHDARRQVVAHLAITEARRLARTRGVLAVGEIDELIADAIDAAPNTAHVQAEFALQMTLAAVHVGDRSARIAKAAEAATKAVRLRPDQIAPRRALGFLQGITANMDEALKSFSIALSIDPDDFEAHHLAAKICMSSGHLRQSIILAERASELDPDDYRPAFTAARAALKLRDEDRAHELGALALRRIDAHLGLGPAPRRYLSARAAAAAMLGRCTEDPQAIWDRAERRPLLYDVIALAHLGAIDLAVDAFDRMVEQGMTYMEWVQADPVSDVLARERRFRQVFDRMQAA